MTSAAVNPKVFEFFESRGISGETVENTRRSSRMRHQGGSDMVERARVITALNYDPSSGVFTWKRRPDVGKSWNTRLAGTRAGRCNNWGHRQIAIDGRLYMAHRLAWLIMTREWPVDQIDHINGDPDDNHWSNLRQANNSENGRNRGATKRNKTGVKGVTWNGDVRRWQACICLNGCQRRIGFFDTIQEAGDAYKAAAQVSHGEFAHV